LSLNALPLFSSFEVFGTTGSLIATSGITISDNRQINSYRVLRDTRPVTFDPEHNFTPREIAEISQSLIDIGLGNFKSTYDTEELFADLDRK
jgi:hypothetical protein